MNNVERVLLKYLKTDYSYQSPVNEKQVEMIISNFDPKALHTIVISERADGSYYIIDGQHRVVALMRLGEISVECTVYRGLSLAEEAEMYRKINERKPKSKNAFAKADLASGVKYAVEIDEVVRAAGFLVDYERSGFALNAIKSYEALRKVYEQYGSQHLYKTLVVAGQYFGTSYKEIQNWTIVGLAEFLHTFPDYDKKTLSSKLGTIPFKEMKKMNNQKKLETGLSVTKSLPFTLVDIYNKRLNKDKQLNAMKLLA